MEKASSTNSSRASCDYLEGILVFSKDAPFGTAKMEELQFKSYKNNSNPN
jgi:hypothetical protein